jgi:hypothetical protein
LLKYRMSGFSWRTASISSRESDPSPPELIEVVTSPATIRSRLAV